MNFKSLSLQVNKTKNQMKKSDFLKHKKLFDIGVIKIKGDSYILKRNKISKIAASSILAAQMLIPMSAYANSNGDTISKITLNKASYLPNEKVEVEFTYKNTTNKAQWINPEVNLYHLDKKIGETKRYPVFLQPGQEVNIKDNKDMADYYAYNTSDLKDFTGYTIKIEIKDENWNLLDTETKALAIESNATTFPRYAAFAGSQWDGFSVTEKTKEKYEQELKDLKDMNINLQMYYDVYYTPTNPFPNTDKFIQPWNTWTHSTIDTNLVKHYVDLNHKYGQKAMLYNMLGAKTPYDNSPISDGQLIYNSLSGPIADFWGGGSNPMKFNMGDNSYQNYYNYAGPQYQEEMSKIMKQALDNGKFDGWQADTIGDNIVTTYEDRFNKDSYFRLSDTYGYAVDKMLPNLGDNKLMTVNNVGGQGVENTASSSEQIVYSELWANNDKDDNYNNRDNNGEHKTYQDLKRVIDNVNKASGKSLLVAAYYEQPAEGGKAKNDKYFNRDGALLLEASIAASGGFHMGMVSNGSYGNVGIGYLSNPYYGNSDISVGRDLNSKLYTYNQYITAYENILRGKDLKEDSANESINIDKGNVWAFAKKGNGYQTINLVNLTNIDNDWMNKDGNSNNKTPNRLRNFKIKGINVGKVSWDRVNEIVNNVYVATPDRPDGDITMRKVKASITGEDEKGYYITIDVPDLRIWNTIYFEN